MTWGGCPAPTTLVIHSLTSQSLYATNSQCAHFIEDTVDLIIWSAVELAVTLICVGIPTVRPLYRTIAHGSCPESSEGRYVKDEDPNHSTRFRMRNLTKDITAFSVVQEGHTESYVTRYSRSDEEILVGQYGSSNDGIRIQEVRVERI